MKRAVLALMLTLLPGMLFAETVMLFTRMQPAETRHGVNLDRFIAVEDGVEDQFFNSGHIIFDTGVPSGKENQKSSTAQTDGWAKRIATAGGADFLLIVNLGFPVSAKPAVLPSTASYRFVNLKTGSMLAEGNVDTQATESDLKSKKPYELCFALGRKIAKYAMTDWEPKQ